MYLKVTITAHVKVQDPALDGEELTEALAKLDDRLNDLELDFLPVDGGSELLDRITTWEAE